MTARTHRSRFCLATAATFALLTSLCAAPPASAAIPTTAQLRTPQTDRQLHQARERLEAVVEDYNTVREDLATTRARLADLQPRLAPMRAAITAQRGQVSRLAASAYRSAASYRVGALLASPIDSGLAQRLALVQQLADHRKRTIGALTAAQRDYLQAQKDLTALAATQHRQHAQLAARRRHIEGEIARLSRLLEPPAPAPDQREEVPRWAHRVPYSPGRAGAVVRFAFAQLGKAYRWAGEGPDAYDCSGLTMTAWRRGGRDLPHSAASQFNVVRRIGRGQLRPGDLVFYYVPITHVGIYVGNGHIVHAPTFGQRVRLDPLDYTAVHGFGRP